MIDASSTVGFVAGTMTTFCFLPQVIKSFKTKSIQDASIGTIILLLLGLCLWLLYGFLINALAIILSSCLSLVFVSIQAVKILKKGTIRHIPLKIFVLNSLVPLPWLVYGFLLNNLPVILSNLVGFVLSILMVICKIKYKSSDTSL